MDKPRSYAEANLELIAAFERYLIARGMAPQTISHYHSDLLPLLESLGECSIAVVDRPGIRAHLAKLQARELSPATIARHLNALRAFFKFLRLTGLAVHDPMILVRGYKQGSRKPVVLTIAEVERLIAAARIPLERAIAEVLYATGVRVSELVSLQLADIDWAGRSIRVEKGKGGKSRYVLFGKYAETAMLDYLKPAEGEPVIESSYRSAEGAWVSYRLRKHASGMLFESPRERHGELPGPYSAARIRQIVALIAHRAGLSHVHPHALRRAMASHMLESGADIRYIQELLGHDRINTTCIYATLSVGKLAEIYARCFPHAQPEAPIPNSEVTTNAQA